jgi:hypothetical protein
MRRRRRRRREDALRTVFPAFTSQKVPSGTNPHYGNIPGMAAETFTRSPVNLTKTKKPHLSSSLSRAPSGSSP